MGRGPKPGVALETWQSCVNPHQLLRWSRRVASARRYLLLACALVRHRPGGVKTDLGRRVLDTLEETARQPPGVVASLFDILNPRFPGVFIAARGYLTTAGRRQVGADFNWLWWFFDRAPVPARAGKPLLSVLLERELVEVRTESTQAAQKEVAALRRELVAGQPRPEPGFLKRMFGWLLAEPAPPPGELGDAVLRRLPEGVRSRVQSTWPPGLPPLAADRRAERALEVYRAGQQVDQAKATMSNLVREVFGDPFRRWRPEPGWVTAHDGVVGRLAEAIDRTDDFTLLPILADALEDAGCQDAAALSHCRGGGLHVPGCWVVATLRDLAPPT